MNTWLCPALKIRIDSHTLLFYSVHYYNVMMTNMCSTNIVIILKLFLSKCMHLITRVYSIQIVAYLTFKSVSGAFVNILTVCLSFLLTRSNNTIIIMIITTATMTISATTIPTMIAVLSSELEASKLKHPCKTKVCLLI